MTASVYWDDGTFGVIKASDLPPNCPRSQTNDTVGDAVKSTSWDPARVQPPGPKSAGKYVKVMLRDLPKWQAAPGWGSVPQELKPSNFGGQGSKKFIPDYPHRCHVCGGRMLILFSSVEHEGGACPGAPKKGKRVLG
jgi:hypothetical protein